MNKILSAAKANLFLAPIGVALAVLSSTFIARWFGPETYADYATLTSLLAWVLLLAESGCNAGIGRYLPEARQNQAEKTLYLTLQKRRWGIVVLWTGLLVFFGPLWADYSGLPPHRWDYPAFLMIGILSGAMLHGQLANFALVSAFYHRNALLVSQIMMLVRAITLLILASFLREPIHLVMALIVLASIESVIMHRMVLKLYKKEDRPLEQTLATQAQKHGLVSQFDKLTSTLASGSFLIIALTASHERAELAMLAVATDLLQKLVSVIALPLSNLILPVLNDARQDKERYIKHVDRFSALTLLLFAIACGATAIALPSGIPLLLGQAYTPAIPLATIWLIPLFIEAGARMVFGSSLITLDYRKWVMAYNAVFGLLAVILLALTYKHSLTAILLALGALRCVMSIFLLRKAYCVGLLTLRTQPWGIIAIVGVATALSYGLLHLIDGVSPLIQLAAGLSLYGIVVLSGLHFLPIVPRSTMETFYHLAGKYSPFIKRLLPRVQNTKRP
jgi:O-antigen/teichoic acid export membrane protein